MDYLIIAATGQEIALFTGELHALQSAGTPAHGRTGSVEVLITGVGLLATTYSLTRAILAKRPDCIIQAGIGGCFDPSFPLGTVVAVEQELVADQGVMENGNWRSTADMGFTPGNLAPYSGGWLVNPGLQLNRTSLPLVNGVTVNQVSTDAELAKQWQHRYGAVTESMEGAALHYVAISEKIPFLQIRALSNYVGERDKKNWDLKNAITSLNLELRKLLPLQ